MTKIMSPEEFEQELRVIGAECYQDKHPPATNKQPLEYEFAQGMGAKHREMPQIQFSTEEVSAILNYRLSSSPGRRDRSDLGCCPAE